VFKKFVLYSPGPPSAYTEGLETRLSIPNLTTQAIGSFNCLEEFFNLVSGHDLLYDTHHRICKTNNLLGDSDIRGGKYRVAVIVGMYMCNPFPDELI